MSYIVVPLHYTTVFFRNQKHSKLLMQNVHTNLLVTFFPKTHSSNLCLFSYVIRNHALFIFFVLLHYFNKYATLNYLGVSLTGYTSREIPFLEKQQLVSCCYFTGDSHSLVNHLSTYKTIYYIISVNSFQ